MAVRASDIGMSAAERHALRRRGAQQEKAGIGGAVGTGLGTVAGLLPLLAGPAGAAMLQYTLPAGAAAGGALGTAVGGELGAAETASANRVLGAADARRQRKLTEEELRERAFDRLRSVR